MKFEWLSRILDWKKDLFVRTQNRLTLQYSALLMIFLTLFIMIVYFLINTVVTFEQERQLQSNAEQAIITIKDSLGDGRLSQQEFENLNTIQESGNQFFYYVVNPNGELLFGKSFIRRLQPEILHRVQGWNPDLREIRYESITLTPPLFERGNRRSPPEREIHLMMTGQAIYQRDLLIGYFYTGRDITFTHELIRSLLTILVALGILFFGIALLLSYFMSKRAMIPIKQSFQRQREFVADASHELRTPLSILHSSLDVFEVEEGEVLSDFSRNVLCNMKDEVRRMTRLVSDLLTLARSDTGFPDLACETFDFIPSIEQMVRSFQTLAQEKEIVLNLHVPSRVIICGDHERLKQLTYILLDNAVKYTPTGGTVNVVLTVESNEKPPHVSLVVEDTGVGIPEEEQERIFERFYRVDKNRSRQMGGTGLGLAIAKWIVDAHHGTIKVSSKLGKGSTLTVTLPLNNTKA